MLSLMARPRKDIVVEVGSSQSINAAETTDAVVLTHEEQIFYPHEEVISNFNSYLIAANHEPPGNTFYSLILLPH